MDERVETTSKIVWYAVYECHDGGGCDADFNWFLTKEEAIAEGRRYLQWASSDDSYVFVVPYDLAKAEADDDWSLWDHLHDIPADQWVWMHGDRSEYTGANNTPPAGRASTYHGDIVADLRSLADGQEDTLGALLSRAADEIERLRNAASE